MNKEGEPKGFLNYNYLDILIQKEAREELDLAMLLDALKNKKITKEQFDEIHLRYTRELELDSLTGISSKRFLRPKLREFISELKQAKIKAQTHQDTSEYERSNELAGVVVIFIDLNNFKKYNDTVGHHAADEELRDFATRLRKSSRSYDLFFRNGGDEFVVIKPIYSHENMTRGDLETIVKKTKIDVNGGLKDIVAKDGSTFNVSASMGSSIVLREDDLDSINETKLIEAADAAMYEDKGKKTRQ